MLPLSAGDGPYGSTRGSVAVCGFLPWSPEHRQHEHPGTHAGLRSIRFYGQVRHNYISISINIIIVVQG